MITYTMEGGTGRVTEIDWKGNVGAAAQAGNVQVGGNYEASVMNGNKFSSEVTAVAGDVNVKAYQQ